jgi:alcohol dehydrogenase
MFTCGGKNIHPGAIETILEAHPAVAQACVVPVPDGGNDGGLAELYRARAHQLVRIPERVSFVEAAALPVAYGTAHRMMFTHGEVKEGEKVLILGVAGGVGVCCVQLAKHVGAEVIACAGSAEARAAAGSGCRSQTELRRTGFRRDMWTRFGKPNRRGQGATNGLDVWW